MNGFIQQKCGYTHLADRDLMMQIFKKDPMKPGERRIWVDGDHETATWRSRQDGLQLMAAGAYAAIRNVVAHSNDLDWSEQECLEYLAVFSTIARWADDARLFSLPPADKKDAPE